MQRGELWAYTPRGLPRLRNVVLVSSDGINDSERPWLLGVELTAGDPGDILAVPVPGQGWVFAGNISRVYRGWLTRRIGRVDTDTLDRLDGALRAALDL